MSAPARYRACPVCGAQVPIDAEFCEVCGSYLGWTAPDPAPQQARQSQPPQQFQPPQSQPRPPQLQTPQLQTPQPPRLQPHPPQDARFPPPVPGATVPPPAAPSGTAGRETTPAPGDEPGAVQPARPVAPRPRSKDAAPTVVDDGIACPRCGTINEPKRRLCRNCAALLHPEDAPAAARGRRRWWLDDPGRWLRRLAWLLLVVALVITGIVFAPLGGRLLQDTLDKLGSAVPAGVTSVRAGTQVPGHPASAAVDGVSNHYWGAPLPDGSWIEFTFERPIRLVDVLVHVGASDELGAFRGQARPVVLNLVATDADGRRHTIPAELADRPGAQRINTGISDVVRLRVTERRVAGAGPGRHVALGEIEFFQRS